MFVPPMAAPIWCKLPFTSKEPMKMEDNAWPGSTVVLWHLILWIKAENIQEITDATITPQWK